MRAVLPVLFLLAWVTAAKADFDSALAAYNRGDYATAFQEFERLAEQGDANAQYNLGFMYAKGEGVPQDYAQAYHWYSKAAEQGHAFAQFILGVMYEKGWGVPQDHAQAVAWYRKAAEQGHASAQSNLGFMYEKGWGVPQDDVQAVHWYSKAAEQGHASAQFNLGLMYAKGEGVPQDYAQAYHWLNLAAAQGHEDARKAREALAGLMTPEQVAEAQRLSREFRPRSPAATETNPPATPGPNAAPDPAGPDRTLVLEVQKQLAALGYYGGAMDGVAGPRTLAAVKAFQGAMGLQPTGAITQELLVLLYGVASQGGKVRVREPEVVATGSGFFVDREGRALTNHHVVVDCASVRVGVNGTPAEAQVIAVDQYNDLALLQAESTAPITPAEFRGEGAIQLAESVVLAGYPLRGLLAKDLNVSTGTVSALAGVGDDARLVQISAPVQPGNSGGPLLDSAGRVIGVVVSKLDVIEIAKVTGTLPENINFAVKGALARSFLDIYGVKYAVARTSDAPRTEEIAERARAYTTLIECLR